MTDPLAKMSCIGWRPVRRDNPASTLRGHVDVELASGLILNDIPVSNTGAHIGGRYLAGCGLFRAPIFPLDSVDTNVTAA